MPSLNKNTSPIGNNTMVAAASSSSAGPAGKAGGVGVERETFQVEHGYVDDEKPEDPRMLTRFFFPSKFGGKPAWLVPEQLPDV